MIEMKLTKILIVLLMLCVAPSVSSFGGQLTSSQCSEAIEIYNDFIKAGFVGKKEYADYYVNEFQWNIMNVDQKRTVLIVLSSHYECTGGGAFRCEVYSYRTGKKLGKYGAFGAKFY